MKDWSKYQKKTSNQKPHQLLINFLNNYAVKNAVDLGCGSGNETIYMLKHGIEVVAVDKQINQTLLEASLTELEKEKISYLESFFEKLIVPKTELITAFFSLPFCEPKSFEELWAKIYEALDINGYFIGTLFGNRDSWNIKKNIVTLKKEEVLKYLEPYRLIKFEEIEYENSKKKWHFFEIIAQKVK